MTSSIRKRREFAPLRDGFGSSTAPKLKGVVFDVDGTLCEPQTYMFAEMRAALSIPKTTDILEHIYSLPTAAARDKAIESIRAIERAAMASQVAQPGLVELMTYLDSRGVRKAICTRNFDAPVAHLLSRFLAGSVFAPIVTREFRPPKPHPAGILHIARSWGLMRAAGAGGATAGAVEEERALEAAEAGEEERGDVGEQVPDANGLIMVGDSADDMTAGRRAGAATVLLVNDVNRHLVEDETTDLAISRLDELIDVLEKGFQGRDI